MAPTGTTTRVVRFFGPGEGLGLVERELPAPGRGSIDAVGEDGHPREVGQRVGGGWSGGHCGHCHPL